jgi:hypothetical protein
LGSCLGGGDKCGNKCGGHSGCSLLDGFKLGSCCKKDDCCQQTSCCEQKGCCEQKPCCEQKCCNADPCEIAELIYKSQTACYAKDRRSAIDDLGDFDCMCNPEIMVAMIYALNDADEKVRKEAADEIGDMVRKNSCCCSQEVTAALTTALADCDRGVRRQAEEALAACGYEVVDGCCNKCDTCCNGHAAPAATPAPAGEAAPAPAPPEDPKAYFPSRLRQQQTSNANGRLANLFGLLD